MPEPLMSEIEYRVDNLVKKWSWVIGGIVERNPQYVRAIIHDFLDVPIPTGTFHSAAGMYQNVETHTEDMV